MHQRELHSLRTAQQHAGETWKGLKSYFAVKDKIQPKLHERLLFSKHSGLVDLGLENISKKVLWQITT